ncbi:MAG: T9SS C-terminal target domain-containing protein [Ignavibacteriales bacterium]|nr:MAG: T9SS C-terminal target domain-containing protein [Ignavibacteriales bacterium]
MKNVTLVLFLILISNSMFCQQFVKKWEIPQKLIYVGDIDGDGIGEFAFCDYKSLTTTYYDGQTLNSKWTFIGGTFDDNWFDADADVHPSFNKFPSIDFNGDGKREMLFFTYTDATQYAKKSILLVDVVNNNTLFEFSDSELIYPKLIAFTDIDGDGKLELVFAFSLENIYKTVAYSTDLHVTSMSQSAKDFPDNYKLLQNYPNPFNPSTTIEYEISQPSNVKVNIYDVAGRLIKELINEQKNTGNHSVTWNGSDNSGNTVASGNYFYQIITNDFIQAKKMIFIK